MLYGNTPLCIDDNQEDSSYYLDNDNHMVEMVKRMNELADENERLKEANDFMRKILKDTVSTMEGNYSKHTGNFFSIRLTVDKKTFDLIHQITE